MEKTCTKCNKETTIDDFYKKGSDKYHTYCKKCFNEITLARQKEIKLMAIGYKGGSCQRCGYNKYVGALEFHHLNPEIKDENWNRFKNRKFDQRFKDELDKCELLCANCHREAHAKMDS